MNPFIALFAIAFVGLMACLVGMAWISSSPTVRRAQELDLLRRTGRVGK